MDAVVFEAILKKTIAPVKIREQLLENDYMSDVKFILGSNSEELRAHKIFLTTASPIFHQLFSEQNENVVVNIQSVSKEVMMEICRFAYTEELKLTASNMYDILNAAHKFHMQILMEKIADFISKQVNEKNVFDILESNQKFNFIRINKQCFDYIKKNHQKCLNTQAFNKLSFEMLSTLVSNCKLPENVTNEAIQRWALFSGNNTSNLSEIFKLMSLNSNRDSDTESVLSQASSKTDKSKRVRNRQKNKPQPPQNVTHFTPMAFYATHPNAPMRQLILSGRISRKNFKYANLDLVIISRPVNIHQINFLYDLRSTDSEVKIRISNNINSFNDQLLIGGQKEFRYYKFMQPLTFHPGTKIWIKIEFNNPEYRQTYDDFTASPSSDQGHVAVVRDASKNSYAQIIQSVIFSVA